MKYGEVLLEKERQKIEQDFLYKVHGFGVVIFRSRRVAFDQRIEQFKIRLDDYAKAIAQQIQASAEATITSLAATLLPLVTKNPPARYLKSASSTPTSGELRQQLVDDLRNKFGITVKTPPVDLKPDNQQSAGNTAGQSNKGEESKGSTIWR